MTTAPEHGRQGSPEERIAPQSFRAEYRKLIREHIDRLSAQLTEQRIDYALLNTAEPLDRALFSYLSSRAKLMKVR